MRFGLWASFDLWTQCFVLGSLVLFCLSLVFVLETALFLRQAEQASATIVDMVRSEDDGHSRALFPVFRFTDAEGEDHVVRSALTTPMYQYQVGEQISVLYRPAHPDSARINEWPFIWQHALASTAFAFALIVFAACQHLMVRPMKRYVTKRWNEKHPVLRVTPARALACLFGLCGASSLVASAVVKVTPLALFLFAFGVIALVFGALIAIIGPKLESAFRSVVTRTKSDEAND